MATIVPRPRTARTPTLTHAVATCLNTPQSFRCAMFAQRFGESKKFKCKTKIKYKCQVLMEASTPLPPHPLLLLFTCMCVCMCRQHLILAKQSVQLQQTFVLFKFCGNLFELLATPATSATALSLSWSCSSVPALWLSCTLFHLAKQFPNSSPNFVLP